MDTITDLMRRNIALLEELETGVEVDPASIPERELTGEAIERRIMKDLNQIFND